MRAAKLAGAANRVDFAKNTAGSGGVEIFAPQTNPGAGSPARVPRKSEHVLVKEPSGQEIELNHYEVLIGRSPMCTVVLEHDSVAQQHAAITFKYDMIEPTLQ